VAHFTRISRFPQDFSSFRTWRSLHKSYSISYHFTLFCFHLSQTGVEQQFYRFNCAICVIFEELVSDGGAGVR